MLQFLAVQAGCRAPRPAVAVSLDAPLREVLARMVGEVRMCARGVCACMMRAVLMTPCRG